MRYDDPELRDQLAAEYVLGTMPSRSRRRFERLMADDPTLARLVGAWADRLTPLDTATPAEEPPARVWRAVEARIAADAAPPAFEHRWFGSLAFWRGLSIAACTAAAALIIYIAAFPARMGPPIPAVVAVLADQSGDPNWIAIAGPQTGEVSVSAIRPQAEDTRHSFELWSIAGGAPRPLGLLRPEAGNAAIIRAAQLPPPGDLLAVSLEPQGGSPTGLPTGPVLSRGKVLLRLP
ncbi:MAG: anti-sigma factor [Alphaproteobacteria bacterium]|nr:anti-sigma factor [Alphaproteobacteria bacterium]